MNIFIDESGNLGTGDRYFVIAALVPYSGTKRIKNLVRHSCVQFGSGTPLQELKAYNLDFKQKQAFFNKLTSKRDFEIAYIVADKRHLDPKLLANQNICFNYLAGMLLKSLIKGKNENMEILFDNRSKKVASGNSLSEYVKIMAYTKWSFGYEVKLGYCDSRSCYHLQAVDMIANAILVRYERKKVHFYRYVRPYIKSKICFPYQEFGRNKQVS